MDRHVYTVSNPLRYVDPTGEDWWNPFDWAASAVNVVAGVADRSVLGQILPYMGWVREHVAKGGIVRGIVVASEFAPELVAAINVVANLTLYRYAVTFSFTRVAPPLPVTK